jgi:hypothetical protein
MVRNRILAVATAGLVMAAVGNCGVGPDEKSGGDQKRESAAVIPLAEPVHDRVAPAEGDATDWKVFEVPVYETIVTIFAWWDNPDALTTITMRDQFGGKMYSLDHQIGKRKETWGDIRVREGKYYLEVHSKGGDTVYTLEVQLEQGGPTPKSGSFRPPP